MDTIVSVIIPCFNEKNYIGICLDSIIQGSFSTEALEILLIDGNSTDGTREIIAEYSSRFPFVKIIDNPKKITPLALNLGILNARGRYIMIASSHAAFPSDYIVRLLDQMRLLNADVVGGKLVTMVKNENFKSLAIAKILSSPVGVGNSMFRIGSDKPIEVDTVPFGIYKREVFEIAGIYNEKLVRNQDIELSKRMIACKLKIFLVPQVSCIYFAREEFWPFAKNNFGNGYWNVQTVYITRRLNALSLRHFVPLSFILALTGGGLLALFVNPVFWLFFLLIYLCYCVLLVWQGIKLNDKTTRLFYIFYGFHVLHFSYGIGSLTGLFNIKSLFSK